MEIKPGDIVYSIAGRDSGNYFVVVGVDGAFAYICDGRARKSDRPKKKKMKHLKSGFGHSEHIANKLVNGEKVTNVELRIELNQYFEADSCN